MRHGQDEYIGRLYLICNALAKLSRKAIAPPPVLRLVTQVFSLYDSIAAELEGSTRSDLLSRKKVLGVMSGATDCGIRMVGPSCVSVRTSGSDRTQSDISASWILPCNYRIQRCESTCSRKLRVLTMFWRAQRRWTPLCHLFFADQRYQPR